MSKDDITFSEDSQSGKDLALDEGDTVEEFEPELPQTLGVMPDEEDDEEDEEYAIDQDEEEDEEEDEDEEDEGSRAEEAVEYAHHNDGQSSRGKEQSIGLAANVSATDASAAADGLATDNGPEQVRFDWESPNEDELNDLLDMARGSYGDLWPNPSPQSKAVSA